MRKDVKNNSNSSLDSKRQNSPNGISDQESPRERRFEGPFEGPSSYPRFCRWSLIRIELLLAAVAAALSMWAASLLPAGLILSGEGLGLFFSDQEQVPVRPASCRIDPDKGTAPEVGHYLNGQGVEDAALVAAGHFTNEIRLGSGDLASIYEGAINQWKEVGWNEAGAIKLYTADPQGQERAGLTAEKVRTLADWDEVVARLEHEPKAMALLPVGMVGPSIRVLSRPIRLDGSPSPELPLRTIAIAGDVMLGNWIRLMGRVKRVVAGERDYPFAFTSSLFRGADLAVVNLECVASEGPRAGGLFGILFRAGEAGLDRIREAGIDFVSLANNHAYDYGEEGLAQMIANLDTRGIRHAGAGVSAEQACAPQKFTIGEARVAFLGLTDIPPNRPVHARSGLIIAGTYPVATGSLRHLQGSSAPPGPTSSDGLAGRWKEAIKDARSDSDIVIVMIHWGEEFSNKQNERQHRLARKMVDLGADLVVGAHPHCVQGIEWIRGEAVIYSIGNFVFALNEIPGRVGEMADGVILQCRILGRRLYQLDITPVLEVLGSPIPIPPGCSDSILASFRSRTMERIYKNSRFGADPEA